MNKILFHYERQYNDNIILIANNHRDLEDYLKANYDWYNISVTEDSVCIVELPGCATDYTELKWVKHI
jgi:hypothetical protein